MNTNQFNRAVALAKQDKVEVVRVEDGKTVILPDGVWELFEGCALPGFVRAACTIEQVAQLIAYQARLVNSGWDENEIKELREIAKSKFQIYGDPLQDAADERKAARAASRRLELEAARAPLRPCGGTYCTDAFGHVDCAEASDDSDQVPATSTTEEFILAGSARRRIRLGGL